MAAHDVEPATRAVVKSHQCTSDESVILFKNDTNPRLMQPNPKMTNTGSRPILPSWAATLIVLIVCGGVSYVVVTLRAQNNELRAALAEIRNTSALTSVASLRSGDQLPATELLGLDGSSADLRQITEAGGVVVFFTTTCPYCRASIPVLAALENDAGAVGIRVTGISLDSVEDTTAYAKEHELPYPVFAVSEPAVSSLPLRGVPTTVAFGTDGVVLEVWYGQLYSGDEITILERVAESVTAAASAPR